MSPRYLLPLIVLLAVALVPIAWRSAEPRRNDPCASPEALKATSLIAGTLARGERLEKRSEDVIQWSEGILSDPPKPRFPMEFQIVRSFDARQLHERTLFLLDEPLEPEEHVVVDIETDAGTIPVHLVRDNTRPAGLTIAYAFVYGNKPVSSPFGRQLASSFRQLVEGTRPLTLMFVAGRAPRRGVQPDIEERAMTWIGSAYEYYAGVCGVAG